jgi:hypothetical protein
MHSEKQNFPTFRLGEDIAKKLVNFIVAQGFHSLSFRQDCLKSSLIIDDNPFITVLILKLYVKNKICLKFLRIFIFMYCIKQTMTMKKVDFYSFFPIKLVVGTVYIKEH